EFELIQPGPNGKMHSGKIKGYDFFDRVYVQYTEIYKYTRGENTIDTDIQKLISMLGISDEEIKSVQDDPERCLILISGKFHKQYQEILNQFLSMNYRLFSFIESSLANEISRCQDPECIDHANIKYREYIEFALAHMTSSEMLVLFYFSKLEKPLSAMLDKLNVFRDIKPEKLIEQNHISLHPQTQGT
ncbi:MAG: putative phage abortive infection protein, partial [Bacteroidota bacterium]